MVEGLTSESVPLRVDSAGAAVADLQARLGSLGFACKGDVLGLFGGATKGAVEAFQEARGLRRDGVCGEQTWAALVEAGYRLGDRLLYYKRPMLRGDDVAELQRRLGALGFDAGRVDGIFGPLTDLALKDFQRNVGAAVDDAILGPETLRILLGLGGRGNGAGVVNDVRERQRLLETPRTLTGRRVVVGQTGGLSALVEAVRRSLSRAGCTVYPLHDPDESAQARQANQLGGQVFVGLRVEPEVEGCWTEYFLGYNGVASEGGRRLAETVRAELPTALGVPDRGARGMRIPVLRETRMPAVLIVLGPAVVVVEHSATVATALTNALATWASSPCEEPSPPAAV